MGNNNNHSNLDKFSKRLTSGGVGTGFVGKEYILMTGQYGGRI
jgi:hypothetical protein